MKEDPEIEETVIDETEIDESQVEIEEAPPAEEVEEDFKDKYFRLLAELENQRKRLHKEKIETSKYAVRGVIRDVLQPLDSMENALKFASQMDGEVANWAQGFVMILGQFKEIMISHGVEPFDSLGAHFDPHLHEAIDTEESDEVEPGIILEEYQKGYNIDGKTLRPAKVKVAKAVNKKIEEINQEQS